MAADIIKFPPTWGKIFRSIDEERKLTGKATKNDCKFSAYCNTLENIAKLRESTNKIIADDPREPYNSHVIMIDFVTNCFEDDQVEIFSDIIKPFDSVDFITDNNGNLSILLLMEGIYEES